MAGSSNCGRIREAIVVDDLSPEINVAELMHKLKEEVATQHTTLHLERSLPNQPSIDIQASLNYIEALLDAAAAKSQIRTSVPPRFNQFPWKLGRRLQRLALKIYAFLFKEQRAVNFSLIQAIRESAVLNQQLSNQILVLQTQLSNLQAKTQASLTESEAYLLTLKKLISEAESQLGTKENHVLDQLYADFEDEFRGSREEIYQRLKVYLPRFEQTNIGSADAPILDVGCGRGEWLELLQESGYTARGLDINQIMLKQCRSRGLEVIESDVIDYLQSLSDNSLGAVTGFHIIEHLPFALFIQLIDESLRVIQPGGIAIFETPNPENLNVGACNFYSDPTHRNPLVPSTVKFLFEQRGFTQVELLRLSEYRIQDSLELLGSEHFLAPQLNPIIAAFKQNFAIAPDFAVIARKG